MTESSWMQDSFLPAGWLMMLDQGREATSWRSPDGRWTKKCPPLLLYPDFFILSFIKN